ncbi:MAG: D-alanyl-D-alanine carboxypeptidase [Clostridia bacterium]|nr:D-alanyl-D-alanine carboxypeptidase [Clostridia bacterium]
MVKKYFPIILIFILLFCTVFAPNSSAYEISGFDVRAKTALLVSLDTDEVIYSKNADEKVYPASLTKMMTAVIVLENTEDLDAEIVTASKSALTKILGTGSTVMGLLEGEKVTARQLLYGLLMTSGGDAAYVIAEHWGGTTSGFAKLMNQKAQELGMTSTNFVNPHGLHDDDHYTTATDLAKLAKYALEFEDFRTIVGARRYSMEATNLHKARTLVTTNYLIDSSTAYYYKYVKGIKTGYTDAAGRCLATYAEKNGYKYLCILLGSPNKNEAGQNVRYEFVDTKNLYEWAFNNFEYKNIGNTTLPICEMPVKLSLDAEHVSLVLERDFKAIMPKQANDSTVQIVNHLVADSVKAPIKKGDILGTADVMYAEQVIATVNLVAANDVDSSAVLVALEHVKGFFTSKGFKIVVIVILMILVLFAMYCVYLNRNRKNKKRKVTYKPLKKSEISDDYFGLK